MHWCADETLMVLRFLLFFPFIWFWLRAGGFKRKSKTIDRAPAVKDVSKNGYTRAPAVKDVSKNGYTLVEVMILIIAMFCLVATTTFLYICYHFLSMVW